MKHPAKNAFDHIVIVMLENSTAANVLHNSYMRGLLDKGVYLANSIGVTHPSQPNYIVTVGGDTLGVIDDTPSFVRWVSYPQGWPQLPPVTSIVDLLEAGGYTWRNYAEDLPSDYKANFTTSADKIYDYMNHYTNLNLSTCPPYNGLIPPDQGYFAKRHVPFLAFPNIVSNPARFANIVDASQLDADLANGTLPNYCWYSPNLINDGHSLTPDQLAANPYNPFTPDNPVNIDNIAAFLSGFLSDDPLAKFPPKTLIAITFDEAFPYYEDYSVYTLLIGDMLEPGTVRKEHYDHYNLLRSVEDNFGLGTLGRNDRNATPYWFLK